MNKWKGEGVNEFTYENWVNFPPSCEVEIEIYYSKKRNK